MRISTETSQHYSEKTSPITTMKSAQLIQKRKFSIVNTPIRHPDLNEIQIQVEGCGICGSNHAVWEGKPWFSYPLEPGAPGHEGWGYITAIGSGVTNFHCGQKVTFLSSKSFAEFETVPSENVIAIPEHYSGIPFPGEPLGCAVNIFERCQVSKNQNVAIIGIGFIGALLTSLCSNIGANVTVFSRRNYGLHIADKFGASMLCKLNENYTSDDFYNKSCGIHEFDCVIEAGGFQKSLDFASKLVKNSGRLIIAGYHQDGPRVVDMQSWNWRGIDVVNAHERDINKYKSGIQKVFDQSLFTQFHFDSLFTHFFSLDTINEGFTMSIERPDGFMKALVLL